jgi:hypothetical protein
MKHAHAPRVWSPSTRAGLLGTGAMLPCPSWSDTHMVRFESSEALAVLPAVARTAVELHGCCARVSLAEALLTAANMLTA